jgi:hypothetical protein
MLRGASEIIDSLSRVLEASTLLKRPREQLAFSSSHHGDYMCFLRHLLQPNVPHSRIELGGWHQLPQSRIG